MNTFAPDKAYGYLPFHAFKSTLLRSTRIHCQGNHKTTTFSTSFNLNDNIVNSIVKSWCIDKKEYKIQVILRFFQIESQENIPQRLPHNIKVVVNGRPCRLPEMNIPVNADVRPWRPNVPINIVQEIDLKIFTNKLQLSWSEEPCDFMIAVYTAEKLTWSELLVDLKKRPLRISRETKQWINKSMENDADLGVHKMFATVRDPLSQRKMALPTRGKDCVHLQCFDAIQFLQMNEQKQTWLCPICKKKLEYENMEVDEFFLTVVQTPNLSEDCESIVLYKDGSWAEQKPTNNSTISKLSKYSQTNNSVEVIILSDSDDDVPRAKRSKYSPSSQRSLEKSSEESLICNSTSIIDIEDLTNDVKSTEDAMKLNGNSTENDLVLDPSVNNSSPSTTSSDNQSVNNRQDINNSKPCTSGNNKKNELKEKPKPRTVLCTITLD